MSAQHNPFGQMWRGSAQASLPEPEETRKQQSPLQQLVSESDISMLGPVSIFEQNPQLIEFYEFTYVPLRYSASTIPSSPFTSGVEVVSMIDNLSSENEVPPTKYAYLQCRAIVGAAYGLLVPRHKTILSLSNIPKPIAITDDLGGIRIAWRNGNKTVRANFGADENLQSYIYFESGQERQVRPLYAASLSDRLNWLITG